MRMFLILVAVLSGLMAAIAFLSVFGRGTDIQLIAAGIYSMVFVLALGCEGIMARLEQIRDKTSPATPQME